MVFVKISLMDFSVIATLVSSGLIVNQVWFVHQMGLFNVVTDSFFLLPSAQKKQYVTLELCVDYCLSSSFGKQIDW